MRIFFLLIGVISLIPAGAQTVPGARAERRDEAARLRERINIDSGWRFYRYASGGDSLIYDERPVVSDRNDSKAADTRASESSVGYVSARALKDWILPTANDFIKDHSKHHKRPSGSPGGNFVFVQADFDDSHWDRVDLPHDWAIKGPFYTEENAIVGGGMGRLPMQGVAWYRRKLDIGAGDKGKSIYLDIDGAMSYAMVWLNGQLVGGWPYGYNSFRLDLSPYVRYGGVNQLAIRIDNPANSSRWYPGAGLYRNVWLEKLSPVHVAQWGTRVVTRDVSAGGGAMDAGGTWGAAGGWGAREAGGTAASAEVSLEVRVENKGIAATKVRVMTDVFFDGEKVASFGSLVRQVGAGSSELVLGRVRLVKPKLWGPPPAQRPNLYVAVTSVFAGGRLVDRYKTSFGVRSVVFDPERGLLVNGRSVRIQGVNQHHDLGALGAAWNERAAERQLELLREMGCNAIRLAHNPPAPELLDLADRMGFLVIDEIFDCWAKGKTPLDFHLIFADWHEADLRSFIRRDKNHPSVIEWSYGNEVGEQYTDTAGASLARELHAIVHDEDSTRPATASMNYAKPDMPFTAVMDVLSLNYQGEGIRDAPAYAHLKGIRTSPLYPGFRARFPSKMIQSSETASALSTRGTYIFPVTDGISAPVSDSTGGDAVTRTVSAYDLYTAAFGASPDKVFGAQDRNAYVAGEFVWSGFDYIGEPTPYYSARSSYSGIIDLAGFPKDQFFLYQSRWRPDLPMVHILPHWTWPDRVGKITPVHVFTSGDAAELFLNGRSLGLKTKADFMYRLRWDSVLYEPGVLKVVAYRNGRVWAVDSVQTAGAASRLGLSADRLVIAADGQDLSFVTVRIFDSAGVVVPADGRLVRFSLSGLGEIVATDNGNPADMDSFGAVQRRLFSGMALVVVRSRKKGVMTLRVEADGVRGADVEVRSK